MSGLSRAGHIIILAFNYYDFNMKSADSELVVWLPVVSLGDRFCDSRKGGTGEVGGFTEGYKGQGQV